MNVICLIDCDNFFASCETLFAPSYKNKPLVVVSGDNGIVIARSKEAKALKIPMGAASFEYKSLFIKKDVIVKQVNHPLYQDISNRIRETVATFSLDTFIYSIDEMFIQIPKDVEIDPLIKAIQKKIKDWTGINTSIGVSKTKTLAKIATELAKRSTFHRCILIDDKKINDTLEVFAVKDIWGVGLSFYTKLNIFGIKTAKELLLFNKESLKKRLGVSISRIVNELEGINSYPFIQPVQEKSMQITKTFRKEIISIDEIKKIVGTFISKGCEKLRKINKEASYLKIFIHSSRFKENRQFFERNFLLDQPSNYPPDFFSFKEDFFNYLIDENIAIKRAGVGFISLTEGSVSQKNLFLPLKPEQKALMKAFDNINLRFGNQSLRFASTESLNRKKPLKSNAYTTCWDSLCEVKG